MTFVTPLIEWLQREKQLHVSSEEILSVLDLPVTTPRTPSVIPSGIGQAHIPPGLRGSLPPMGTSAGSGAGRGKKKEIDPNAPRCQYKFVRGSKKDQYCGEPAVVGTQYCKACGKKKGVQAQESTQNVVVPGFGHTRPIKAIQQQKKEEVELNVTAIPDREGYFISSGLDRDYVLHRIAQDTYVAVSLIEDGVERQLSVDEKNHVRATYGLRVLDDEESSTPNVDQREFPTIQQSNQPTLLNKSLMVGQQQPLPGSLPGTSQSLGPRLGVSIPSFGMQGALKPPMLSRPGQTIQHLQ